MGSPAICRVCGTTLDKHSIYMLRLCDATLRDQTERRELEERLNRDPKGRRAPDWRELKQNLATPETADDRERHDDDQ